MDGYIFLNATSFQTIHRGHGIESVVDRFLLHLPFYLLRRMMGAVFLGFPYHDTPGIPFVEGILGGSK